MSKIMNDKTPIDVIKTYGRMACFKLPDDISDDDIRNASPELIARMRAERNSWRLMAKDNVTTYLGKDYVWRFITKAVDSSTSQPFYTTGTLEQDDYLSWIAIGTGGTGAPDPNAFKLSTDNIAQYRGRGRIIQSINIDPSTAPHAVEISAFVLGIDLRPALGSNDSYDINEAALVPYNSQDHTGTYPGNQVVAYCTFDSVPMTVNDRWVWTWILGVA